MGGYGHSIQTVINNNKKILRERDFLNRSYAKSNSKLKFKDVSAEKLNQIKLEIRRKAKKEKRKKRIISAVLFIACFVISVYVVFSVFLDLLPL